MRVVSVPLITPNASKAWVVDKDCNLISVAITGGIVVVSTDPALLSATWTGTPPAGSSTTGDVLCTKGNSGGLELLFGSAKIPLLKDSTLYFANTTACWVSLLLEDVLSAEIPVT